VHKLLRDEEPFAFYTHGYYASGFASTFERQYFEKHKGDVPQSTLRAMRQINFPYPSEHGEDQIRSMRLRRSRILDRKDVMYTSCDWFLHCLGMMLYLYVNNQFTYPIPPCKYIGFTHPQECQNTLDEVSVSVGKSWRTRCGDCACCTLDAMGTRTFDPMYQLVETMKPEADDDYCMSEDLMKRVVHDFVRRHWRTFLSVEQMKKHHTGSIRHPRGHQMEQVIMPAVWWNHGVSFRTIMDVCFGVTFHDYHLDRMFGTTSHWAEETDKFLLAFLPNELEM
jgi:hypothetical protein